MAQKIEKPAGAAARLHKTRRDRTVALGATILTLAAVGICLIAFLIVKSTAGYVKNFLGPDETPDYFNKYLAPAMMFDPAPFDGIAKAKPEWELETAIWAALDTGEQSGQFAVTDDGQEILPVRDVAANLKEYFGGAVKPAYKTFTDGGFTYQFDKKNQCFDIPLTAVTSFYLPRVTKITRNFKTVTLVVDYIPGKDWGRDQDVTHAAADKTMDFVLSGGNGGYQIKALKVDKTAKTAASAVQDATA